VNIHYIIFTATILTTITIIFTTITIVTIINTYLACTIILSLLIILSLADIYVNDLFAEIVDGVILLKIINLLRPGMVNNKKISLQTSSRFKKVVQYAVMVMVMMIVVVMMMVGMKNGRA